MTVKIENEHLLTDRFGRWPSFHDAEIVSARFERSGPDAPFLECDIHVFEMTTEIDEAGFYILKHHTLVTLRFCDIALERFAGWNEQNALWSLDIQPAVSADQSAQDSYSIEVDMPSSYGCEAKLWCRAVKILNARDFAPT